MSHEYVPAMAAFIITLFALVMPQYEILVPEVCKVLVDERVTFQGLQNVMAVVGALLGALLLSRECAFYILSLLLCFYVAYSFCLLNFKFVPSSNMQVSPFRINQLVAPIAPIILVTVATIIIVVLINWLAFPHDPHRWKCPRCKTTNGVFVPKCQSCGKERAPSPS